MLRYEKFKKQMLLPKISSKLLVHPFKYVILKLEPSYCYTIYIYSKTYYKVYLLNSKNINNAYIDNYVSSISINSYKVYSYSAYLRVFTAISNIYTTISFIKLKFKGKGYYIFKNYRNTIAPRFGKSHRVYVYALSTFINFLNKTTILVFGINNKDIICNSLAIKDIKNINIFTGRGIRFSKQYIYKKKLVIS